jgi:hypothetical protein
MNRLVVAAAFTAGLMASLLLVTARQGSADAAVRASNRTIALSVGDRFRVEGAPLGCRVARIQAYGSRVFVDCRRAGPLTGSYGTLVSGREAMVVRFRDARTAKVVFQAKHEGVPLRCR